jgi:hypothetical protein
MYITSGGSRYAHQAGLMFYLSATAETDKGADMTRKDYQVMAEAIASAIQISEKAGAETFALHVLIGTLSHRLQQDNPRFDMERFSAEVRKLAVAA